MTFKQYETLFREKAALSGYSEDNIVKCLKYAKPLIEADLPVIYNTANLAAFVGYKKNYIKKAALFTSYFYRDFSIKKKNGKLRHLKEPLPSLKEIQCWILENILYKIPVSRFAKAYIKNRNLIDNVKYHKNRETIVNLDINEFFSSIKRPYIEKIFLNLGYSSNVSNLLSKLCSCNEVLPQGAPTSPYLSNLYLSDFDEKISSYCKYKDIRYTRYADDMTFSGKIDSERLIKFVSSITSYYKLEINTQKTKVLGRNQRQTVTGIVVNDIIQIPKKKRDKIRQEVYYIKKLGLSSHLLKTGNKRQNYLQHLLGQINFALYINSTDWEMQQYNLFINELIIAEKHKI
jgi:RNA-directed DNA polymerase